MDLLTVFSTWINEGIGTFLQSNPGGEAFEPLSIIEALIMGIVQGLTEYLPVSSSGHLALYQHFFGARHEENLTFVVLLHAATALSSIIYFWKDIVEILKGLLEFKWNDSWKFVAKIAISAVPVVIIGLFFEDTVDQFFSAEKVTVLGTQVTSIILVGVCLIFTAILLILTKVIKSNEKEIGMGHALIIGVAQAIAVLPGISRSGSTIATALLLGIDKAKAARFSFLMVIVPILGKTALDVKDMIFPDPGAPVTADAPVAALIVGFITAFGVGLLACFLMYQLVKKGGIYWFSFYCAVVGIITILAGAGVFG